MSEILSRAIRTAPAAIAMNLNSARLSLRHSTALGNAFGLNRRLATSATNAKPEETQPAGEQKDPRKAAPLVEAKDAATLVQNLAPYNSIKDFEDYIIRSAANSGKISKQFVPGNGGWNVWTARPELLDFTKKHFGPVVNGFAVSAPVHSTASHDPKTRIVSDADTKAQDMQFNRAQPYVSIASGGISALWATLLMTYMYREALLPQGVKPPLYIIPSNIKNSATKGSSGQFHVSHASPMYTDPEFGALNIFGQTVKRSLFNVDPKVDNYMIGQISLKSLVKNPFAMARVGIGYWMHGLKYKFDKKFDRLNILDETIPLAIESGQIMDAVSARLIRDGVTKDPIFVRNRTLRVACNESETKEMEELQVVLEKYKHLHRGNIKLNKVSAEKSEEISGTKPRIKEGGSYWEVVGDGNMAPNSFDVLCKAIKKNGGEVKDGMITSILCDTHNGNRVTGVVYDGGLEDGVAKPVALRTNSVYTSFGANGKYTFDPNIKARNPIEPIIAATGYSAYLLVRGHIKCPVDSNNHHFTPYGTVLVDGKPCTIIKTTGGAAIGTNSFCVPHAINNLYYATEIIFPGKVMAEVPEQEVERMVDIVSARSCSRPINAKNTGKITEVLPGLHVGTGFGGKGITDAAAFGAQFVESQIGADLEAVRTFRHRYGMQHVQRSK